MKAPPNVVYAQLKYMWSTGAREESLNFLRQFSASLARDLQVESKDHSQRSGVGKPKLDELSRLLARCYFKQGQWQVELKEDWGAVSALIPFPSLTHQLVSGMSKTYCIRTF
jgi:FKBP12-rapamycin complex-associated protein